MYAKKTSECRQELQMFLHSYRTSQLESMSHQQTETSITQHYLR